MSNRKDYKNLIVLIVILVGIGAYFIAQTVNPNEMLLSAGFYDEKITVMNTADVHGHIVYDDSVGEYYSLDDVSVIMGLPLVKHFVNQVKKENPNMILLDSGDMFHGTNEANIEKGKGVVEVVNLMGYTAMTIGNHDFNFGLDRLKEIKSQLNYPILSANVYQNGELICDEYKIIEIGNKKIGLFGLTTQIAVDYINSRDKSGLWIEDPEPAAARVVEKLKDQVDLIILISHLGDTIDKQVIDKVSGIDLVLCGHYHKLYNSVVKYRSTYMVEAGGYTTHVGVADLYLKAGKVAAVSWKIYSTKNKAYIDQNIDQIAQEYYRQAYESGKEVIGRANAKLNGIRAQCRSQETNLANLLTDAMKKAGHADLTLMNGGGIRESIPQGDISVYQVSKTLPFTNSLVTVEVKGDKIYSAIERGLRKYPGEGNGPFLQVSGISYVFDGSKPAGRRLVKVIKDGQPLDKDKYYRVATNDYLYNGGDDYVEFQNTKLISFGALLKDVLTNYIKEQKEVAPQEEGRIQVINKRY